MIHQAQFLERMPTRDPGSQSCALRYAAMRRASPTACAQVHSRTWPPPNGCVRNTRSARSRSQR